jgi:hypothetical protein
VAAAVAPLSASEQSMSVQRGTRQVPIWSRWLGEPIAEGTEPDEVGGGEIPAILEYLKTLQLPLAKTA